MMSVVFAVRATGFLKLGNGSDADILSRADSGYDSRLR
jgi:hypothetical protein